MSEPTGRPSSQELADRVRESLVNAARWTSQEDYRYDERDSGLAALDVLAARLQATEQALEQVARAAREYRRHVWPHAGNYVQGKAADELKAALARLEDTR